MNARLKLAKRWFLQRWLWRRPSPEPPRLPRAELWPKVHDILTKELKIPASRITPQAHFVDDLSIDSLDAVELVMSIEEEFGIEIPDEEAEKLTTVPELLLYLEQRMTYGNRLAGG